MQQLHGKDLTHAIRAAIRMNLPMMIWGMPGVGKSEIVKQITREDGAVGIDIRLSQYDSVDLRGIPAVTKSEIGGHGSMTMWCPPITLPFIGNPNFNIDKPIYLFLDELPQALPAVQAVAFQLVLDRRIGEHQLMPNVHVIAAGNREGDKAGSHRMLSALSNRFMHVELGVNLDSWTDWAWKNGVHEMVIGFLQFRPNLLNTFISEQGVVTADKAFATSRTWKYVSDIVHAQLPESLRFALIAGCVGEGPSAEFLAFLRTWEKMPDIEFILKNPTKADVPKDPAILFAVSAALAGRADKDTFDNIVTYVSRLPPEYAYRTVFDAVRRDVTLNQTKAFVKFAGTHQSMMEGN